MIWARMLAYSTGTVDQELVCRFHQVRRWIPSVPVQSSVGPKGPERGFIRLEVPELFQ
jgi:hypothetical protein